MKRNAHRLAHSYGVVMACALRLDSPFFARGKTNDLREIGAKGLKFATPETAQLQLVIPIENLPLLVDIT